MVKVNMVADKWNDLRAKLTAAVNTSGTVYEKIKRKDRKEQFRDVFLTHDALTLLERQQYTQALQLLEQVAPKTMRERVVLSVNYARVYLAQGETEKAKEALTFVAENGNKLYIATRARQMLSEMEENTPA